MENNTPKFIQSHEDAAEVSEFVSQTVKTILKSAFCGTPMNKTFETFMRYVPNMARTLAIEFCGQRGYHGAVAEYLTMSILGSMAGTCAINIADQMGLGSVAVVVPPKGQEATGEKPKRFDPSSN